MDLNDENFLEAQKIVPPSFALKSLKNPLLS